MKTKTKKIKKQKNKKIKGGTHSNEHKSLYQQAVNKRK
jgi:hypothetical protein